MESNLSFRFMSLGFRFRDLHLPRTEILKEAGIKPGFRVVDYGCGAGSYVPAAPDLVGASGRVYALDFHPLAIESVKRLVSKRGLTNVETILSDCRTGLPEESVDVVLLYDIYHDLAKPAAVLKEIHRVLKPEGILSFNDHHMEDEEVVSKIGGGPLSRFARRGGMTHMFSKTRSQ